MTFDYLSSLNCNLSREITIVGVTPLSLMKMEWRVKNPSQCCATQLKTEMKEWLVLRKTQSQTPSNNCSSSFIHHVPNLSPGYLRNLSQSQQFAFHCLTSGFYDDSIHNLTRLLLARISAHSHSDTSSHRQAPRSHFLKIKTHMCLLTADIVQRYFMIWI